MDQALQGPGARGGGEVPAAEDGVGQLRGGDAARPRVHGASYVRPEARHARVLLPLLESGTA